MFLVDDVVSTGGTMTAVIQALKHIGTNIVDVMTIKKKGEGKEVVEKNTGVKVKTLVRANVVEGKVVVEEITAGKE